MRPGDLDPMTKKHLFFIIVSLIIICALNLQNFSFNSSKSTENFLVQKCFEKPFIGTNSIIKHVFTFKNNFDSIINIKNKESSCSCTSVSVSKSQLKPGETAELTMSLVASATGGERQYFCKLTTDYRDKKFEFYLNVKIYPKIDIHPSSIDLYEDKNFRDEADALFTIDSFATSRTTLPEIARVVPGENIDAREVGTPSDEVNSHGLVHRQHRFKVGFDNKLGLAGDAKKFGAVTIVFTDGTARTINVNYHSIQDVKFHPGTLCFGIMAPGETKKLFGFIRMGEKISLEGIDCDEKNLIVSRGPDRGSVVIELGVPSNFGGDSMTGQIIIRTDSPRSPVVSVPWSTIISRQISDDTEGEGRKP